MSFVGSLAAIGTAISTAVASAATTAGTAIGGSLGAGLVGSASTIGAAAEGIAGGAALGAATGGIGAAATGGDVGEGIGMGALTGAVTGGVSGALGAAGGAATAGEQVATEVAAQAGTQGAEQAAQLAAQQATQQTAQQATQQTAQQATQQATQQAVQQAGQQAAQQAGISALTPTSFISDAGQQIAKEAVAQPALSATEQVAQSATNAYLPSVPSGYDSAVSGTISGPQVMPVADSGVNVAPGSNEVSGLQAQADIQQSLPSASEFIRQDTGVNSAMGDLGKAYSGLSSPQKLALGAAGSVGLESLLSSSGSSDYEEPDKNKITPSVPWKWMGPSSYSYSPSTYQPYVAAPNVYTPRYAEGGITDLSSFNTNLQPNSPVSVRQTQMMARGGISSLGSYSDGGQLLKGPGGGLDDKIPASIGGEQPARLADGEFVVSSDVVSALGGGSTDEGAKKLYAMMDRVRKQAHGTKKQIRKVNNKALPA